MSSAGAYVSTERSTRWWITVLALSLLALLIRLWVLSGPVVAPTSDAADYSYLAASLATGHGYVMPSGVPTAWRPPGYPVFLAAVYRVFGVSTSAAVHVQAVLGAATVLLLAILAAMTVGAGAGLVASAIAAVYPVLLWMPRTLMSENLSVPLAIAVLCAAAALTAPNRRSPVLAFLLGLLLGWSVLVRGANLFVAVVLVAGLWLCWRRFSVGLRRGVRLTALIAIGGALVMVPWTVRNVRVFHHFVPVATQDGLTLFASYWPPEKQGKRIWGTLPFNDSAVVRAYKLPDEVAASQYLDSVVKARLEAHPGTFVKLAPEKLFYLMVPVDWEILPQHGRSGRRNWAYALLLLPAAFGVWRLLRSRPLTAWPLAVVPLATLVQTILFYGSPRFRLPAETVAIVFAAVGILELVRLARFRAGERLRSRHSEAFHGAP